MDGKAYSVHVRTVQIRADKVFTVQEIVRGLRECYVVMIPTNEDKSRNLRSGKEHR